MNCDVSSFTDWFYRRQEMFEVRRMSCWLRSPLRLRIPACLCGTFTVHRIRSTTGTILEPVCLQVRCGFSSDPM